MSQSILTIVGFGFGFVSLLLVLLGPVETKINRFLIAGIGFSVAILAVVVLRNELDRRTQKEALEDVQALLAKTGDSTFEDIYAQISPRRNHATLTAAIDKGLSAKTLFANRSPATLEGNVIANVRVYSLQEDSQ